MSGDRVQVKAPGGAHGIHKDYQAAKIGMWLFLFTEIILFGGLFILYSAYRARYTPDFHRGGQELNFRIGVANTIILLTSSLTMALSITAIQKSDRKRSLIFLFITMALGASFLVNKGFEWSHEFHKGIYPTSAHLGGLPKGEALFYTLYYVMTGLHGLHVIAGIILLGTMFVFLWKGRIHAGDFVRLENSGLYWHLVDVIWIFLLPLFYLAA